MEISWLSDEGKLVADTVKAIGMSACCFLLQSMPCCNMSDCTVYTHTHTHKCKEGEKEVDNKTSGKVTS